jgi:HTH-type transcriptional regulator/antitoxin HigA
MSLRYDRNDSFWFTLCHELAHIEHRDESPLDADLTDKMEGITVVRHEMERRANEEASDTLVPKNEIDSFVVRVGPLYSKDKIVKFAYRIKMHPGIIVGQLQRRHEIGYSANREMLSKIRNFVISASLTDGWGHTLDQGSA